MRAVLMINGPLPPEGKEFCPVCVSLYKHQAEVFFRQAIEAGLRDHSTTGPIVLDLAEARIRTPEFAEVVSISILPQLGLLRICWGHVAAAQLTALPPAMQGQMPGIPSLGGPR
jgi:hypothetical protein